MRLLDTYTGHFVEKDPRDHDTRYAILSHKWDCKGEQSYTDLKTIQEQYPRISDTNSLEPPLSPIWDDSELSEKIRDACAFARADGYRYIWIDSCCIDKTSSSELSESINSMYAWYARAEVCYTYLADVPSATKEDPSKLGWYMCKSLWFQRGWTLQELIAPRRLFFLSCKWEFLGSKLDLSDKVSKITGIDKEVLLNPDSLDNFSVAQRFSWASKRKTTKAEDRAYSLLGIFDINMPTLYGEGERAFRRLQEEIMRRNPDQSLFAWGVVYPGSPIFSGDIPRGPQSLSYMPKNPQQRLSLLAPSLDAFADCGKIEAIPSQEVFRRLSHSDHPAPDYTFTPNGIRTEFPVIPLSHYFPSASTKYGQDVPQAQWYLIILGCMDNSKDDTAGRLLGRVCYLSSLGSNVDLLYCGSMEIYPGSFDIFPLSRELETWRFLHYIQFKTIYISHANRTSAAPEVVEDSCPHQMIDLVLNTETREALLKLGYTPELASSHDPAIHLLKISKNQRTIVVLEYRHTLEDDYTGQRLTINAKVKPSLLPLDSTGTPPSQHITLSWTDRMPWRRALPTSKGEEIAFKLDDITGMKVILGLAFIETNRYSLHVDILIHKLPSPRAPSSGRSNMSTTKRLELAIVKEDENGSSCGGAALASNSRSE